MNRNYFQVARFGFFLVAALGFVAPVRAYAFADSHGVNVTVYKPTQWPPELDSDPVVCEGSQTHADIIDEDWGGGIVAGCDYDGVVVHYSGYITIPERVLLVVQHDDGAALLLNGDYWVDAWYDTGCAWDNVWVDPGTYSLDFWFYENGGGACAKLWYGDEQQYSYQPVPTEWLSTEFVEPSTTTEPATTTEPETTTSEVTTSPLPEVSSTTTPPEPLLTMPLDTEAPTTTWETPTTFTTVPTTSSTIALTIPAPVTEVPPIEVTTTTSQFVPTTLPPVIPTRTTTTPPTLPPSVTELETTTEPPTTAPNAPETTTPTDTTPDPAQALVDGLTSGDLTPEEITAAVDNLISDGITVDQATELATSPEVLATITGEQAAEIFDAVVVSDLTAEQAAEIVAAVQDAPDEVRQSFETQIDVFSGAFDTYVPLGSTVAVSVRRTIVAGTIATTSVVSVRRRR